MVELNTLTAEMNLRSIFLALFFTSLSVVHAEDEKANPVFSFRIYLWPGENPPGVQTVPTPDSNAASNKEEDGIDFMDPYEPPLIEYCPTGEGEAVQIKAEAQRISPLYEYSSSDPLTFFQEIYTSNNSFSRKTLGKIGLPPNQKQSLLIFYPKSESTGYDIFPVDSSQRGIPAGKSRVYNLTTTPVACLFNQQSIRLEPGESELAELGPNQDFSVTIRIGAPNEEGKWRERYAQRLRIPPEASILTLIYRKSGNRNAYRVTALEIPEE